MLSPDYEIPKRYQPMFTQAVESLLRKGGSLLESTCIPGTYKGESAEVVKQYGKAGARVGSEDRYGDTPINTTPRDARWVYPTTVDAGDLFDREDQVRMLIDETSPIVQGFVSDMGEALDESIIVPAFFGDAKTGKNGGTTTVFPATANDVGIQVGSPVGAPVDTGMNVAKLLKARQMLRKNKNKLGREPFYCGLTSLAEAELFSDPMYGNRDWGEPILDNGHLKDYLGFTFVPMEEWPWAANVRSVPAWARSGMHLGTWNAVATKLGEDSTKKFNIRAYVWMIKGCTRTQEGKVIRIKLKDTEH